jgi:preprotein translocase subunit Sec61beta
MAKKNKAYLPSAIGLYRFDEEEKSLFQLSPYHIIIITLLFVVLEFILHILFKIKV